MKELFQYLVIRLTTRHAKTALDIYTTIYHTKSNETTDQKSVTVKAIPVQNSKKDELIDSLNYLKNKKVKSKQDKESIYSLEMVLKNM